MRIWTVHPQYLDAKGLVAAWREALLAQHVLSGATVGYRQHPQLIRFKQSPEPARAIAAYLQALYAEANKRGYTFNASKIIAPPSTLLIPTTHGQLQYEWAHLKEKLRIRAPEKYREIALLDEPAAHPLFTLVDGPVEAWEVQRGAMNDER